MTTYVKFLQFGAFELDFNTFVIQYHTYFIVRTKGSIITVKFISYFTHSSEKL